MPLKILVMSYNLRFATPSFVEIVFKSTISPEAFLIRSINFLVIRNSDESKRDLFHFGAFLMCTACTLSSKSMLFFMAAGRPRWCGPGAGGAPAPLSGPRASWADSVLAAADSWCPASGPLPLHPVSSSTFCWLGQNLPARRWFLSKAHRGLAAFSDMHLARTICGHMDECTTAQVLVLGIIKQTREDQGDSRFSGCYTHHVADRPPPN